MKIFRANKLIFQTTLYATLAVMGVFLGFQLAEASDPAVMPLCGISCKSETTQYKCDNCCTEKCWTQSNEEGNACDLWCQENY